MCTRMNRYNQTPYLDWMPLVSMLRSGSGCCRCRDWDSDWDSCCRCRNSCCRCRDWDSDCDNCCRCSGFDSNDFDAFSNSDSCGCDA